MKTEEWHKSKVRVDVGEFIRSKAMYDITSPEFMEWLEKRSKKTFTIRICPVCGGERLLSYYDPPV